MAKSPKGEGGKGKSRSAKPAKPATGAGTPRYDDRPDVARRGSGARAGDNPSIPRYGDTEPGDPRRADVEASLDDDDAEIAGDELDMTGDEEEEET